MPSGPQQVPVALTIAGSDSSGGAGIQADLKTFAAFGVYGASAITALTAQNTQGVAGVMPVPAEFIAAQMKAVAEDLHVAAIKTGMLGTAEAIRAVAANLALFGGVPLIVDPVMVATSGARLLDNDALDVLKRELLPRADLVTPNLPEAAALLGLPEAKTDDEIAGQAVAILQLGARRVLIKGGHGTGAEAVDWLFDGERRVRLAGPRIDTKNTHGTGCTLSAAITAMCAQGIPLEAAVRRAKHYVGQAIEAARDQRLGKGHGPLDHLFAIKRQPPPA